MNTPKEKQNSKRHKKNICISPIFRPAVRRRTLLASQDEVNKMYSIGFNDLPFKVRPPVMFKPSEKEVA